MLILIGDVVRIHPGTDLFMRGEHYGTVENVGRKFIHILGHRSGRKFKVTRSCLLEE